MPRVIVKCRYYKNTPNQNLGGLMKYVATRDGVEKLPKEQAQLQETEKQNQFIMQMVSEKPFLKSSAEYKVYAKEKTRGSASEFISSAVESHPEILREDSYLRYMATRPRVEKIAGNHGLFSKEGVQINLEDEVRKLESHNGNVFSVIVSLKREDAARLGYDKAEEWQNLVRRVSDQLAINHRIPIENFSWYAAFHNESYHPHIHILMYSNDESADGYITKKGIDNLRHLFGTEIFKDELHDIYDNQTAARNMLTKEMRSEFAKILSEIQKGSFIDEALAQKIGELMERLKNCTGKKQYGYLPKGVKALVDEIVDDVAKDEKIDRLYELWYQAKCSVMYTYTDNPPERQPMSKEKELKAIRNALIYECEKAARINYVSGKKNDKKSGLSSKLGVKTAAINFAYHLSRIFSESFNKYTGDDEDIDKKLRREIEAIKNGENITM